MAETLITRVSVAIAKSSSMAGSLSMPKVIKDGAIRCHKEDYFHQCTSLLDRMGATIFFSAQKDKKE
jgi:hypothetical protein